MFKYMSSHQRPVTLSDGSPAKKVEFKRARGRNSTKFYTERRCPEVQRLNLLYTFLGRKGTPFVNKQHPFHIRVENFATLLAAVSALYHKINHKTRKFSPLFHSHKILLQPFQVILQTKMTDVTAHSYTSTSEFPTLSYT